MLDIVIPLAGRGSRFANSGYLLPKPLIPVHGMPMIELVGRNLWTKIPHRFIFLCLKDHLRDFELGKCLQNWFPGCEIMPVSTVTEGAACTVLLAEEKLSRDGALIIANCDQFIETSIDDWLTGYELSVDSGNIMTMKASDAKWSFIEPHGSLVARVVEKEVISEEATVGIYLFSRGRDFVNNAKEMISRNLRVNNEFYVAPVYNLLINKGARIRFRNIGTVGAGMHGLGTPEDLEVFLSLPNSKAWVAAVKKEK